MDIEMIDIEEAIRLGHADIIYQDSEGIIIHELRSDALMISMNNSCRFIEIYEKYDLQQFDLIDVKQEEIKDILVNRYHKTFQFACYQSVYTSQKKKKLEILENVKIKSLKREYLSSVYSCYKHSDDINYLKNIINRGHLWGIFENNDLVGFIGIHDEGSMGILEVKEEYKRKGFGSLLESYLINYFIDNDWIPYCQVIENNNASLALQKKLGLEISKHLSYWLFP